MVVPLLLLHYSPIDGHLSCFEFFSSTNNATGNILAPILLCPCRSVSDEEISRGGITGPKVLWNSSTWFWGEEYSISEHSSDRELQNNTQDELWVSCKECPKVLHFGLGLVRNVPVGFLTKIIKRAGFPSRGLPALWPACEKRFHGSIRISHEPTSWSPVLTDHTWIWAVLRLVGALLKTEQRPQEAFGCQHLSSHNPGVQRVSGGTSGS